MKILMGTKNPGKIEGAKRALENYYKDVEVVGVYSDEIEAAKQMKKAKRALAEGF